MNFHKNINFLRGRAPQKQQVTVDNVHVVVNNIPIDVEVFGIICEFSGSADGGKRFLASLLAGLFVIMRFSDLDNVELNTIRLLIDYGKEAALRARQHNIEPRTISILCEYSSELIARCGRPANIQTRINEILKAT